ncbi:hypothetical protein Ddye_011356 [Dipteronia dyeriana]|uniref:Uncharacterized protein n=1 Tax=Dipteronia dyeriana TaxID=168575 RepID=A0AAD9WKA4_9ROSI|nr:hypothetical protein Ddye_032669 [Dipteronia dyeriana]KAK2651500.1 hypothetical protein Ddye_011356 [Dipteronia dyeriana]
MEGNKTNIHESHEDHQNKAVEILLQKTLADLVQALSSTKDQDKTNACIQVQRKALDDLVNVNSLFAIAVFVGMAFANPNQRSLENRPECDPDPGLGKMLIIYEVNSFACFLLSSLVAKSTKVLLNIRKKEQTRNHRLVPDRLCKKVLLSEPWKRISMGLSVLASFAGIVLMTLSMVYVVQIRVGKLFCGSDYAIRAVAPLCAIVFTGLLFYVPSMAYAVIVTASACQNCEDMKMASIDLVTPKAPADV